MAEYVLFVLIAVTFLSGSVALGCCAHTKPYQKPDPSPTPYYPPD